MSQATAAARDNTPPTSTWVMLIYTVSATPTSRRAAVWREVKRLGALYLRDGVCALPETATARAGLEALSDRVQGFGGQAVLVLNAWLPSSKAEELRDELTRARQAEYADLAESAKGLLRHIREQTAHDTLEQAARATLNGDITRLRRWLDQILARDYLDAADPVPITDLLAACSAELDASLMSADKIRPLRHA